LRDVPNDATKEIYLTELNRKIEKDIHFLGVSAIRDCLQDQVVCTLKDLQNANIKVCMLTGDKKETAEIVGKSCGLLEKKGIYFEIDNSNLNEIS